MAVYTTGGGGFLGGLGKALSIGSMFIPGLQPIAAGANMIGGIANGDPMAAIMGGLGMMKGADGKPLLGGDGGLFGKLFGGGQKQPQPNSSFLDAMRSAHSAGLNNEYGNSVYDGSSGSGAVGQEFELFPRGADAYKQQPFKSNWGEGYEPWSKSIRPQSSDRDELNERYTNPWGWRYQR